VNLRFLGDALDYWKGSVFLRLQNRGVLKDFLVDPMLTDPEDWHADDFRLYADLLQMRPDQILRHNGKLQENRETYFAEVIHTGDLFVDPDTGIGLGYARHAERYIRVKEVHQLLGEKLPRILCIYQHIGREKTRDRVSKLITALAEFGARIYCCSYETPTVAMLFVSQKQNRIEQVSECFKNYLGRHSERVRLW
jgi:hypothetical protein